ncbi:BTAD domain-containing putative transcriptional regulator [Streptomyces aidingensis]|uniref:DNA-binding transcriptional activator of the SARP family n=1 Tax=Streptomyces aidingensis TaxID=910347 RepID=A0A1I1IH54_9ACTN|nr:BTAD domain-containing putative transcriptional regulator [Streptomyces aidingensis]SFC35594.1 DNA-binding transcriptional activator of the SARP family [Streptomyces aidingensis]
MDIRLLGPLELLDKGVRLPLAGPTQRLALAGLALCAGQTVSSDELARLLCSPRTAVHSAMARLRRALPEGAVETVPGGGYRLRSGRTAVDLARFEDALDRSRALAAEPAGRAEAAAVLAQALTLWRGTPLAGLPDDSPLVRRERPRLVDLELTAREEWFGLRLALGEHSVVLDELTDAVRLHPLRERFAVHLVLALFRCGRAKEALQTAREARHRLGRPARELRELARAVRHDDPRLLLPGPDPADGAAAAAVPPASPPPAAPVPAPVPAPAADPAPRELRWPPPEGAGVLPLLGIADVRTYSSSSTAAVAGCAPSHASRALEQLAAAGVTSVRGPGVFTLTDAGREAAVREAAKLPPEQHRRHLAGLACWYLGSLYRINVPLAVPGNYRVRYHDGADRFPQGRLFTSVDEALPWADAVLEDVLSLAVQLCVPEYDDGTELAGRPLSSFALEAVRALESYLAIRLRWRVQRRLNELVLAVAERRDDVFARAVALGQLGKVHALRGEGEEGMELLRRSEELFRSAGQRQEAVVALSNMVPCLGNSGRIAEAAEMARRALAEAGKLGMDDLQVTIQTNLGRCHLHLGNHAEARGLITESYAAAKLPYGRTHAAGVLAEYHLATGEFTEAARWAGRALGHAAEQPFDPYLVAKQRTWLAAALRGMGREAQARVEEMQAEALLEDLNTREHSRVRPLPPGVSLRGTDGAGVPGGAVLEGLHKQVTPAATDGGS